MRASHRLAVVSALLVVAGNSVTVVAESHEASAWRPAPTEATVESQDAGAIPMVDPSGQPYDHEATLVVDAAVALSERLVVVPGFSSVSLVDNERTIIVHWVGGVTSTTRDLVRRILGPGIPFEIVPAAFTERELMRLAKAVSQITDPTLGGSRVLSAGPNPNGNGLIVGAPPDSRLFEMTQPELSAALGVAVPIALEVGGEGELMSRQVDNGSSTPGSRIQVSFEPCTSGFKVYDIRAKENGQLIAAHCDGGYGVGEAVVNDAGFKGYIRRLDDDRDIAIIRDGPEGYEAAIYDGYWDTSEKTPSYGAALKPLQGMNGCLSASYSGRLCGIEITVVAEFVNGDGPFIRGVRYADGGAGGVGDSGGPYFRYVFHENRNEFRAKALGIVSRSVPNSSARNCAGVTAACFTRVRYASMYAADGPMDFHLSSSP